MNGGTIKKFDRRFQLLKTEVESKELTKTVVLCSAPPIESIYVRAVVRYNERIEKKCNPL